HYCASLQSRVANHLSTLAQLHDNLHPHRHSSPTRRSSELDLLDLPLPRERALGAAVASRLRRRRDLTRLEIGDQHRRSQGAGDQDWKSIRLNSSHRMISYAVLCVERNIQRTVT